MPRLRWLGAFVVGGCFVEPPPLVAASSESDDGAQTSDALETTALPGDDTEADEDSTAAAPQSSSSDDDDQHGTSGAPIDCAPTPAGIVAWWRGDGDMTDSIGGVAASAVGGLEANAAGYVGEAFHFDGVDDALAIGDALVFAEPTDSFTVEAWVRLDALEQPRATDATVPGDMEIVGKMAAGATANADGWRLFKQTDADELWFCVGAPANGCRPDGENTVRTGSTPVNEWLHVGAVRDGDRIAIHLDGVLVDESMLVDAIDTSAAAVSIGASTAEVTDDYTSFFFGTIDEVAFYDRALASTELAELANSPAGKCR